jgi:diguanylate cyclase (GGDEF)-like protein
MTRDEVDEVNEPEAATVAEPRSKSRFKLRLPSSPRGSMHRFFGRPSRQVAALACVSVVAVLAVASVSTMLIGRAEANLNEVTSRFRPVGLKLALAQRNYAAMGAALAPLATTANPADQAGGISSVTTVSTEAQNAWLAFKKASLDLPGEAALQAKYQTDYDAMIALATTLFQGGSVELAVQLQTGFTAIDADLQGLREIYTAKTSAALTVATANAESAKSTTYVASGVALLFLVAIFALALGAARARQREVEEREAERHIQSQRSDLETRLQRALEMVHSEDQAFTIVEDVLRRSVEVVPAEVLVADSSHAHFHQVASTDAEGRGPGCPVSEPRECPAANRGQTQVFPSSNDIDACPYLRDRAGPACSAVCVPMSIAGKTVGVIHTTTTDNENFARETVTSLELVARKTGDRIGMMRAFERSETQARTDPLTGLLNRRSLEDAVRNLADEAPYAVAYGDLDHFKMLNDVHGHDAGDRALRVFARVLRDSVRPSDIPARYGGEEFVIVLPNCHTEGDALIVVERVRERLLAAQEGSPLPSFTVSFGVALSESGAPFSEIVDSADQALLTAKATGRDRVVFSGSAVPSKAEADDPDLAPEPLAA